MKYFHFFINIHFYFLAFIIVIHEFHPDYYYFVVFFNKLVNYLFLNIKTSEHNFFMIL